LGVTSACFARKKTRVPVVPQKTLPGADPWRDFFGGTPEHSTPNPIELLQNRPFLTRAGLVMFLSVHPRNKDRWHGAVACGRGGSAPWVGAGGGKPGPRGGLVSGKGEAGDREPDWLNVGHETCTATGVV